MGFSTGSSRIRPLIALVCSILALFYGLDDASAAVVPEDGGVTTMRLPFAQASWFKITCDTVCHGQNAFDLMKTSGVTYGQGVVSPVKGKVTRVQTCTAAQAKIPSNYCAVAYCNGKTLTGPSAGSTMEIEYATGKHVTLIHIDPSVGAGTQVSEGTTVGTVHNLDTPSGSVCSHLHFWSPVSPIKLAGRVYNASYDWDGKNTGKAAEKIANHVLFTSTGYGGTRAYVAADDPNLSDTPVGSNNVESLIVNEGCKIRLIDKATGTSKDFVASTSDLGSWRNKADAFQILDDSARGPCGGKPRDG